MEFPEIVEEFVDRRNLQGALDESSQRVVVRFVDIDPTGIQLGLFDRLVHVLLNSLDKTVHLVGAQRLQRPGSDQRLIEKVLLVGVRNFGAGRFHTGVLIHLMPTMNSLFPDIGNFRENIDPGPHIFAAFSVVSRRGGQSMGPLLQPLLILYMKGGCRNSEALRIAADLVERRKRIKAVACGVFETLGHHRPGELLEAHHELVPLLSLSLGQPLGMLQ